MKTKSIIIIVLIFSFGFLLGLISAGLIQHAQMKKFRTMVAEKGFGHHFIQHIEPTSEQLYVIEPIIEKYNKRSRKIGREIRTEMHILMDSLQIELDPYLTEKQKEILKNKGHNRRSFFHPFRKGRPPFLMEKEDVKSED